MVKAVIDTHALIWYLFGDQRLSDTARATIDSIQQDGQHIAVSTITLVEVVYLAEKSKIESATFERILTTLDLPNSWLIETPIDRLVVQALNLLPRAEVPDMPDRIIGATTLYLGVPVISRDGKIRSSGLQSIW
jgi:PIN domain nuclease of toxin-antitoxin system